MNCHHQDSLTPPTQRALSQRLLWEVNKSINILSWHLLPYSLGYRKHSTPPTKAHVLSYRAKDPEQPLTPRRHWTHRRPYHQSYYTHLGGVREKHLQSKRREEEARKSGCTVSCTHVRTDRRSFIGQAFLREIPAHPINTVPKARASLWPLRI